ncbi:MAG TPA: hydrogenase maturation nickel metallochaperone HypA [Candidatus Krumholzibacteria bacterium]|nr:hydrogenase maturation nickel metallochaperone HypA [Candidatus Krumholzibacteria bacterium]HPD70339.1 hydrogenase maturation nickel metallochaperone HypA [Candidatus Krumholzibacteria bacterium]HRY39961.1 hydrogenase maturation nickel metallochaperone HypA [Candidatus Krumholzibacteria bacterium]
MHELAVTQGILDLVLDAARREGGGRVTAIDLVVGELASIVDDSVQFYWDLIAEDTPAAGARLRFRRVPLQFECRSCRALFERKGDVFACPACGHDGVRVAAGDELRVESFDLEDDVPREP